MNGQDWDDADSALLMLEALDGRGLDRPLRAFACACCRVLAHLLPNESREALAVAEAHARGTASDDDLAAAHVTAQLGRRRVSEGRGHGKRKLRTSERLAFVVECLTAPDAWQAAREAVSLTIDLCGRQPADLPREYVGNPFQSANDPPGSADTPGSPDNRC